MLRDLWRALFLAAAARHGAISLPREPEAGGRGVGRGDRHRLAAPRIRADALTGQGFWALIEELGVRVLPNTAGCRTAKEAIATAQMARELFGTDLDQARSHRQ